MQVFKYYFQIVKKGTIGSILMYLGISIAICICFGSFSNSDTNDFEQTRYNVTIYDNDNSELSKSFTEYMKKYADIVDVKNDEMSRKTALYYKNSNAIITIPEDFEKSFEGENPLQLDVQTLDGTAQSAYCKIHINNYLNTVSMYKKTTTLPIDEINNLVQKDLDVNTNVKFSKETVTTSFSSKNLFINYFNYFIFSTAIIVIMNIAVTFKKKELNKRLNASSQTLKSINIKLFLCHLTIMLLMYLTFMLVGAIMYKLLPTTKEQILFYINAFIISLVALGIALMLSNVVKRKFIAPVVTVIALGTSFLGGSFVPQEYLSGAAKISSVINPVYWYVKANNTISSISTYSFDNLKNVFGYMSIEILFFAAFITISFVMDKRKRTSEN